MDLWPSPWSTDTSAVSCDVILVNHLPLPGVVSKKRSLAVGQYWIQHFQWVLVNHCPFSQAQPTIKTKHETASGGKHTRPTLLWVCSTSWNHSYNSVSRRETPRHPGCPEDRWPSLVPPNHWACYTAVGEQEQTDYYVAVCKWSLVSIAQSGY